MSHLIIYTDGGARGNPGPAGTGFVISKADQTIGSSGDYIGNATNNEAEYQAVIKALEWLVEHPQENPLELDFRLDSNLVVNQLKGLFKIKQAHLLILAQRIHSLIMKLKATASYTHVYREQNTQADALVNQALDRVVGPRF
jgi:ribonuclease HI